MAGLGSLGKQKASLLKRWHMSLSFQTRTRFNPGPKPAVLRFECASGSPGELAGLQITLGLTRVSDFMEQGMAYERVSFPDADFAKSPDDADALVGTALFANRGPKSSSVEYERVESLALFSSHPLGDGVYTVPYSTASKVGSQTGG